MKVALNPMSVLIRDRENTWRDTRGEAIKTEMEPGVIEPEAKASQEPFPDGPVVKNPPANAENTGSIPGLGRFHMPRATKPGRHSY